MDKTTFPEKQGSPQESKHTDATVSSWQSKMMSCPPKQRLFFFMTFYAVVFMGVMVLLEGYSLWVLQHQRQYLDPLSRQVMLQPSTYVMLLAAALFFGALLGCVMGFLEWLFTWPNHPLLRAVSFVLRGFLLLIWFAFHWVNQVFFDTIQNYLSYLPINPARLLDHQGEVFYGRMLYDSLGLLFYYYSPVHVVVWVLFVFGFFAIPLLVQQLAPAWLYSRSQQWGLVGVLGMCLVLVSVPTWVVSSTHLRPLCTSTSMSMWWAPGCRLPFPVASLPATTAKNREILAGYQASLRLQQSNTLPLLPTVSRSNPTVRSRSKPTTNPGHSSHKATTKGISSPRKPNIILLIMESISSRHVGAYGYTRRKTTPVLDRYAPACQKHDWAFSNGNISKYGISAIFASRLKESPLDPRNPQTHPIFPEQLRASGYVTGLFVAGYRYEQGVEAYIRPTQWDRFFDSYNAQTYRFRPRGRCVLDCHMLQEAKFWLAQRSQQKEPVFLAISFYSSHFPYKQTPRTWKPLFFQKELEFYSPIYFPRSQLELVKSYYDDALRYVDHAQGELLDWLKTLGMHDNTVIVFTADHGEDLYERGEPSHGTNLYNPQVQIPLVLCGPGIKPGIRKDNVSLIDLGPTLLDVAKIPAHFSYEGRSLLQPESRLPRPVYLINDFIRKGEAVIVGDYKFIRSYSRQREELYNIRKDPAERDDLLEKEPLLAQTLRWILQDHGKRKGWIWH